MDLAKYYIIEINEDGEVRVSENTAEDMKKLLNSDPDDWDAEIDAEACNIAMPKESDPQYWGDNRILIIKGKIVAPEVVTRIVSYEIE